MNTLMVAYALALVAFGGAVAVVAVIGLLGYHIGLSSLVPF
jgi:hypothetical protein